MIDDDRIAQARGVMVNRRLTRPRPQFPPTGITGAGRRGRHTMSDTQAEAAIPLKDAEETRRPPELEAADKRVTAKTLALLKRALRQAESDSGAAARIALKAVEAAPDCAIAHHVCGLCFDRSGVLSRALHHYEAAWKLDPTDVNLYQNLGLVAWKLEMKEAAEKFFRILLRMQPGSLDGSINLAGVLRDQGQFDEAVEILRLAIYQNETAPSAWNALGTVLLEAGDPYQAITFYEEAIRLSPQFARGWHNLAYALDLTGQGGEALAAFDTALDHVRAPGDEAEMRHGQAQTLLGVGEIARGWEAYDIRTSAQYQKSTVFALQAPRWDGAREALRGKRVLLVGEQGIGDEILFLNAARDLQEAIGEDGQLLIACTERLVPLIQRSFPKAHVGGHTTFSAEGRKFRAVKWLEQHGGCDLWLPMGDLGKAFRAGLSDFPSQPGFLTVDKARRAKLAETLAAIGKGPKIGLVWKSLLMAGNRTKYFSAFDAWKPVLQTPGVHFVSLQYGDTDAERARAEDSFGATIHQIDGLDLKDDLDGVATLGAALDLSLGPMNASTNLAAAAGGEVWFTAYRGHWPLLGTDRLPWYANSRAFTPARFGDWDAMMTELAGALAARIAQVKAA